MSCVESSGGVESRLIWHNFQAAVRLAQADAAAVLARPFSPEEDGLEVLAQFGDESVLETVETLASVAPERWEHLRPGHGDPIVWRLSPAHERWLPLYLERQPVGYLFLKYQAPRHWSEDLERRLQTLVDALGFHVAMWRRSREAQLFRAVVDQSVDAIAIVDGQGRVVYANGAHARLLGRSSPRELVGRRLDQIVPGLPDLTRDTATLPYRAQEIAVGPDGQRWVDSHAFPVTVDDNQRRYLAVIHRDVTGPHELRRRLEVKNDELSAVNARLRQAQLTQETFLAMVTHELKTPLHILLNAVATLKRRGNALEEGARQEILEILEESGTQLGELIEDLLTVTRIQTGALTVEAEPLDLVREVESCVQCWNDDRIALRLESCPNEVPILVGDRRRMRQVLDNLLANALAHCRTQVVISVGVEEQAVVVEIWNDGETIAEEERDQIFQPFFRGKHSPPGGVGLGLAVARGLVEAHGGRIEAVPAQDGARFRVWLPYGSPGGGIQDDGR